MMDREGLGDISGPLFQLKPIEVIDYEKGGGWIPREAQMMFELKLPTS